MGGKQDGEEAYGEEAHGEAGGGGQDPAGGGRPAWATQGEVSGWPEGSTESLRGGPGEPAGERRQSQGPGKRLGFRVWGPLLRSLWGVRSEARVSERSWSPWEEGFQA